MSIKYKEKANRIAKPRLQYATLFPMSNKAKAGQSANQPKTGELHPPEKTHRLNTTKWQNRINKWARMVEFSTFLLKKPIVNK